MFEFNPDKLAVNLYKIKQITTALGGSIRVLDEDHYNKTGEERFTKKKVPFAVARKFIKQHGRSQFLKPMLTAVTEYDGVVVSLELFNPITSNYTEEQWIPQSKQNVNKFLYPLQSSDEGRWCIDGKHVYWLPNDDRQILNSSIELSRDGKFRALKVNAFVLQNLPLSRKGFVLLPRCALVYVTNAGNVAMTPPIWKSLEKIGIRQIERADETPDENFPFDKIDRLLSVNLSFVLNAAKEISNIFGYDAIAPLQLPTLMVKLKTVNLPQIPQSIKYTFDVGTPFTHLLAWLIGLSLKTKNINDSMKIQGVLKYLTTKGIFHNHMFDPSHIYVDPDQATLPEAKTIEQSRQIERTTLPLEVFSLFPRR